jgi:hypothetical protein
MENSKFEVQIVEYDKRYASIEAVRRIFIDNYAQHMNSYNFAGLYHPMLSKYGKLT